MFSREVYLAQRDRIYIATEAKRPSKKYYLSSTTIMRVQMLSFVLLNYSAICGWELLPHPLYSFIETPMDYHANQLLKNWLAAEVFDDLDDLVADMAI